MSRTCYHCRKKPLVGNKISHANNKTKRRTLPNLQRFKTLIEGVTKTIHLCTRCIKARLYTKVV